MPTFDTREAWLTAAVDWFRPAFQELDAPLPAVVRVTMGFPSRGKASRAIGETWYPEAAQDGATNVYIKPTFGATGEADILAILAHELCHAAGAKGHGKAFKRLAHGIGLSGPMRSTHAGVELARDLDALARHLGDIPHGAIDPGQSPVKKQGTRQRKVICAICGYTARTTAKWLEMVGAPHCGVAEHGRMGVCEERVE